jgi:hypothetical protein
MASAQMPVGAFLHQPLVSEATGSRSCARGRGTHVGYRARPTVSASLTAEPVVPRVAAKCSLSKSSGLTHSCSVTAHQLESHQSGHGGAAPPAVDEIAITPACELSITALSLQAPAIPGARADALTPQTRRSSPPRCATSRSTSFSIRSEGPRPRHQLLGHSSTGPEPPAPESRRLARPEHVATKPSWSWSPTLPGAVRKTCGAIAVHRASVRLLAGPGGNAAGAPNGPILFSG